MKPESVDLEGSITELIQRGKVAPAAMDRSGFEGSVTMITDNSALRAVRPRMRVASMPNRKAYTEDFNNISVR